jgi:hypothetical protein
MNIAIHFVKDVRRHEILNMKIRIYRKAYVCFGLGHRAHNPSSKEKISFKGRKREREKRKLGG